MPLVTYNNTEIIFISLVAGVLLATTIFMIFYPDENTLLKDINNIIDRDKPAVKKPIVKNGADKKPTDKNGADKKPVKVQVTEF